MTQVKVQDADCDEINQHSPNDRSNDKFFSQENQKSPISDSRSRTNSGNTCAKGKGLSTKKAEDFWDEYENKQSAISFGSTRNSESDENKRNGDETDHSTGVIWNDENKGILRIRLKIISNIKRMKRHFYKKTIACSIFYKMSTCA